MASSSRSSGRPISRRQFLQTGVLGLSAAAAAAGLLGCSPATQAPVPTAAPAKPAAPAPAAPAAPAASSAPAVSSGQKTITFKIGHAEAISSPMNNGFERWIKLLDEKSGGVLKGQNFPAMQLGPWEQILQGNRMGTNEVMTAGVNIEDKLAPTVAALCLPYLFQSVEHVDRVLQGPLGARIAEEAKNKTGVDYIAYGEESFRQLFTKRPVQSLADIKGMKIRASDALMLRMFELLGASPTPLGYDQLYSALQSGVVEGGEAAVFAIDGYKFQEQAPNITLSNHWFIFKAIRVNAKWLGGLPSDLQTLMRDTAKTVFADERAESRKGVDTVTKKLEGLGAKFYKVDLEPWRKVTAPQYDEYVKQYPEAADMIKQVQALA